MDNTHSLNHQPFSCSFVLMSCHYGPQINKISPTSQPTQITLKFSEENDKNFFQKYLTTQSQDNLQRKSINGQHPDSEMITNNEHKEWENQIPTKKITQSNFFETTDQSCETFKKDPKNRISLKQKLRRNSSSLCEIVSKLEKNWSEDSNVTQGEKVPRIQIKNVFKKKKSSQSEEGNFMDENQFKKHYQQEIKAKPKFQPIRASAKYINTQNRTKNIALRAKDPNIVGEQPLKKIKNTFRIIDNTISFTKIIDSEENSPKSRDACTFEKMIACRNVESSQRRRDKGQAFSEHPSAILQSNNYYPSKSNVEQHCHQYSQEECQKNGEGEEFPTLVDISKNVQSIRDRESSQPMSIVMSHPDSLSSRQSSSDGSKLYRTIKRLTSKNISQVSR